jgi:hypothetical protein
VGHPYFLQKISNLRYREYILRKVDNFQQAEIREFVEAQRRARLTTQSQCQGIDMPWQFFSYRQSAVCFVACRINR